MPHRRELSSRPMPSSRTACRRTGRQAEAQNAAPLDPPNWILSRPNASSNSPMMSPRMAKDIAVAIRAMQLATNRRLRVHTVSPRMTNGFMKV